MKREEDETPPDDLPELMDRYKAGDEAAFEELYGRLVRSVRGYLRTMVPPGAEVEDSVQTTFLQLHRSRQSYISGLPLRPWLFAIAHHVGQMVRRSSGRRVRHEVQPEEEPLEIPVLAQAAGALDRIALERALRSITQPGREVLWLRYVEGLSVREVAAVLGISVTAAKVRAHRAVLSLRERFTEGPA